MKTIPLCDLKEQYKAIREDVLSKFDEICLNSAFIKGKYVEEFEEQFKRANLSDFGAGCANGTSAISLALESLGIGRGDEVILPSHTFIATAEAIIHVGATPVFCDIKPDDYTICPAEIEKKITSKTKAIIPVHIYGTACDMNEISDIASKNNLAIIEDCAQAHFAKYNDQFVGTIGDAATFSFYPGKNLGAYGDAGFVLCKKSKVEEKLKKLIDHGRLNKFDHDIVGYNCRIDAIQAAILSIKISYIHKWTKRRQEIAALYDEAFKKLGFKVINYSKEKLPVYHVYIIEVENRDEVRKKLSECGISTGIHYPIPVHKTTAFNKYSNDLLPVTEQITSKILSLPIYPEMSDEDVSYIIDNFLKTQKELQVLT